MVSPVVAKLTLCETRGLTWDHIYGEAVSRQVDRTTTNEPRAASRNCADRLHSLVRRLAAKLNKSVAELVAFKVRKPVPKRFDEESSRPAE